MAAPGRKALPSMEEGRVWARDLNQGLKSVDAI